MPKLTQRMIDISQHPESGQVFLRDDELRSFGIRITPGSKSYFVECRVNGKPKRITVGKHPLITLEEARKQGKELLRQMSMGFDPLAERRRTETSNITLAEVLEVYLATKELRPGTITVYRGQVNHAFKEWLGKPLSAITKDMVEDKHRAMTNGTRRGGHSGRAYANCAFKTLQAIINFANEKYEVDGQPLLPVNPVSRLTKTRAWYRVHPRTGVIPEHKMADWYKAVQELEQKHVADYFVLVLFTGLRRREATDLKWSDVDFDAKTLTVRREQAKNHKDHVLPLSSFLFNLLKRRYESKTVSSYVFPGKGNRGHLTDFRFALSEVREKCGCKFMIHDMRRTFMTAAERLDTPYYVLKKLANHTIRPDTLTPYIVVSSERLRIHMEKISEHFLKLMGVSGTDMSAISEAKHVQLECG